MWTVKIIWRISLLLLINCQTGFAIIRNDISDRCIHLDTPLNNKTNKSLLVYAKACNWDSADLKYKSGKEQWTEIVAIQNYTAFPYLSVQPYFIRKVDKMEPELCLAAINNEPVVSESCLSPSAYFALDRVYQKNFKGAVTSVTAFKIRNLFGKCLTVEPGKETLKFKECSPRKGLFQIWSVCRHNRKCDVDVTWTPRKIEFPTNKSMLIGNRPNKISSSHIPENLEQNLHHHQVTTVENNGIINEVLYSVQNLLKLFGNSDEFLLSSLAAFYPQNKLYEAAMTVTTICQRQTFTCTPCRDRMNQNDSADVIIKWIMLWMKNCNNNNLSLPYNFLSQDALQVPLFLFPNAEPSYIHTWTSDTAKIKQIIPSLKKFLNELEVSANQVKDELVENNNNRQNIPKPENIVLHSDNGTKTDESHTEKAPNYEQNKYAGEIDLPDIDIRIQASLVNITDSKDSS